MVDLLDGVRRCDRYPDTVLEHELSEALSINEYDLDIEPVCVVDRIFRKARGGDKYSFAGTKALECSGELLQFGSPHRSFPALCLEIDDIKPKPILLNDSIHTFISASADSLYSFLVRTAIPHLDEQLYNQTLEELRSGLTPLWWTG